MSGNPDRKRRRRAERFVRNFQENGIQVLLEHPANVRDLLGLTGEDLVAEIDLDPDAPGAGTRSSRATTGTGRAMWCWWRLFERGLRTGD